MFKCPELSMLLWKANSLANKEQGLVRSSCFILVFKHLDWHSLKGFLKVFIISEKELLFAYCKGCGERVEESVIQETSKLSISLLYFAPQPPTVAQPPNILPSRLLPGTWQEFLLFFFIFYLFKIDLFNLAHQGHFSSRQVLQLKTTNINILMMIWFNLTYFYPWNYLHKLVSLWHHSLTNIQVWFSCWTSFSFSALPVPNLVFLKTILFIEVNTLNYLDEKN